jgi:hypothetical protein
MADCYETQGRVHKSCGVEFLRTTSCGHDRQKLSFETASMGRAFIMRFSGVGRENLVIPFGDCSGGKFVVSRAGETYTARVRGLNRKFRLESPGGFPRRAKFTFSFGGSVSAVCLQLVGWLRRPEGCHTATKRFDVPSDGLEESLGAGRSSHLRLYLKIEWRKL